MTASKPCHRDAIEDIWGPRSPFRGEGEWPVRVDENIEETPDKWVQSACIMCSNGCGMDIGVKDGRIVGVRGRAVDRVNKGRLGPKGLYAWQAQKHKDRLKYPMIRKNGKLQQASWDEAMELIVNKTHETIDRLTEHGIGFYTTGQLFLEEYYTLAVIGKGGLSTLHMDGNTRLCTATAAASMRESFGSDGQPGSYTDIDVTDCILLVGHNMASTQTVLWARILDRLEGPNPPKIIVIDPRTSPTAKKATVHISPKVGTNMAVLNGLLHLLFEGGYEDKEYIEKHTIGIEDLRSKVKEYTPEHVHKIADVPMETLSCAAKILGEAKTLLSTALQGVYQSNQATASACQINNINLIMGKIGKPGSGIFQMNGQPTAQNNREAGCDGEFPGFRNHQNKQHMQELADYWKIPLEQLPHWQEPTHIMQMLNHIADDTIEMFWISGTNPLVTLPDSGRIRTLLTKPNMFVVVQDIFMSETAEIADVVLPAAQWGEKTGCFTNVDRTVHISHKAVEPPGEAKSDMDIFVDYATRMEFKDKHGDPLVHWKTPEEAFEAWKMTTKGRPCDYTGLSYDKLTGGSGIQWPCNEDYPDGRERLFDDAHFYTASTECESYGHDLETGTTITPEAYNNMNPAGKAILKACHYFPSIEEQNDEYPFQLMTGRNVYQFHTRTKTARSTELHKAAPEALAQISHEDGAMLDIRDGDMVLIESRRGKIQIPARLGDIPKGRVFIPMHWGGFDSKDGRKRAANELTTDNWDSISKQPTFKSGAVKMTKITDNQIHAKYEKIEPAQNTSKNSERHRQLFFWLGATEASLDCLEEIFDALSSRYPTMSEFVAGLKVNKNIVKGITDDMSPIYDRYGLNRKSGNAVASHLKEALFFNQDKMAERHGKLSTTYDFLADVHNLYAYVAHVVGCFIALKPTSGALWDSEFVEVVGRANVEIQRVSDWIKMQLTVNAAQTLIVPAKVHVDDS